MREYVTVVRRLLNLETVTYEREVGIVRDLRLDLGYDLPRSLSEVPIYISATGPKMMEVAGEIADGVFHNFFTSVSYLRESLQRVNLGSEPAGRRIQDVDMPQMVAVAMSQDAGSARIPLITPSLCIWTSSPILPSLVSWTKI